MSKVTREDVEYQLAIAYGKHADKVTEIISREETDAQLMHVSKDAKIKQFVPRFSKRLIDGETTAIPRVSTAPTLMQCFVGRGDPLYENSDAFADDNLVIYTVYGFDWDFAVKPIRGLLPDIDYTDEHWLLACTPETRVYIPRLLGTCFLSTIQMTPMGDDTIMDYTFCLNAYMPLAITPTQIVKKGCYQIRVPNWKSPTLDLHGIEIKPMSEGDFQLAYVKRKQITRTKKK